MFTKSFTTYMNMLIFFTTFRRQNILTKITKLLPEEPRDTLHECDRLTFLQFPKAVEFGLKLSFKIISLITSKSFEIYVKVKPTF